MNRELMGTYVIWLRDFKRFWRDKSRRASAIFRPILYLVILGTGLQSAFTMSQGGKNVNIGFLPPGVSFIEFMFPGIIAMSLLFAAMFSAMSIVWDREFGFLKEVLVAPVSRTTVVMGKCLGGATQAMLEGCILLIMAYIPVLVGIYPTPVQVIKLLLIMVLISLSITSLGILVASGVQTMEGFGMVINFIILPMFLVSGALFPIERLPVWMSILVKLDPLTYGVDALRGVVIGRQAYPLWVDLLVIVAFGAVMLYLATIVFNRKE